MDIQKFREVLPSLCAADTAAGGGKGWTPENPTFGHCAVVSLLAQDLFGGELLRISLEGTPFAEGGSHYYNHLPDGTVVDFTAQQFGDWKCDGIPTEIRARERTLGGADTRTRYELLKARLAEALG